MKQKTKRAIIARNIIMSYIYTLYLFLRDRVSQSVIRIYFTFFFLQCIKTLSLCTEH